MISKGDFLTKYIESVAQITNSQDFDSCLEALLCRLSKSDISTFDPIVLFALSNSICAQILILTNKSTLSDPARKLIEFLHKKDLLPPLYSKIFFSAEFKLAIPSFNSGFSGRPGFFPDRQTNGYLPVFNIESIEMDLSKLLKTEDKASKSISKNFGYSILDTNGDFIWLDEKSENLFEVKKLKVYSSNLFQLMIPFSKNVLMSRFGNELFGSDLLKNQSLVFSQVIYSKESMKKFLKSIRKLPPQKKKELNNRLNVDPSSVYQKYLKSLSSRATLIVLKFTKSEFQNIIENRSKEIQMAEHLHQALQKNNSEHLSNAVENESMDPFFKFSVTVADKSQPIKNADSREIKEYEESHMENDDSEIVYRNGVLLETRLSYNTPLFDYSKMEQDESIVHFRKKLISRLVVN